MSTFAGVAVALYAAHHVGDYWVQTDHQARHKGDAGREGAKACTLHVLSYLFTQTFFLAMVVAVTGVDISAPGLAAALLVSGGTHYLADRREHGVMLRLVRLIGKGNFLHVSAGPEALDQAWHVFWGVFVSALLIAGLS